MAFTAKDIVKHQFGKSLRGYDPIEVEAFLEVVSDKFSDILEENKKLNSKVITYEKNFKEFDSARHKFKDNQVNAQKDLKILRTKAEKEAKIIYMDAKIKSENIINKAYKDVARLRQEVDELRELKSSITNRFRSMLSQHLKTLELYSGDRADERIKNYNQNSRVN